MMCFLNVCKKHKREFKNDNKKSQWIIVVARCGMLLTGGAALFHRKQYSALNCGAINDERGRKRSSTVKVCAFY